MLMRTDLLRELDSLGQRVLDAPGPGTWCRPIAEQSRFHKIAIAVPGSA